MRARGDPEALFQEAAKLGAAAARRKSRRRSLPPLFFVTDPVRTPDPLSVARRLPHGCGVIYRSFGDPNGVKIALALAAIAKTRGLVLLIGQDAALAARAGAHGVHLPERSLGTAWRMRRRGWILTGAAHSARGVLAAGRYGLDAVLLSPVFDSRSPSAGRPLGPVRFARLARQARLPVYALGGINRLTLRCLAGAGASGAAAVEALSGR